MQNIFCHSSVQNLSCSFTLVWERYISEFSRDVWLGLSKLLLHCVRLGSLYFLKAFFHIFQSTQRSNDVWQEQTLLSGSFRRTKVKDRFCTTEQRVFSFLTKGLIYWSFFPFFLLIYYYSPSETGLWEEILPTEKKIRFSLKEMVQLIF